MLKELSQVNLNASQLAKLQDFIVKNKGALIKDTIIQKMTGFGGLRKEFGPNLSEFIRK